MLKHEKGSPTKPNKINYCIEVLCSRKGTSNLENISQVSLLEEENILSKQAKGEKGIFRVTVKGLF